VEKKCGTCLSFAVRPTEIELSRMAKPMSACGPGAYCHGGPVRGWCKNHGSMEESTNVKGCYRPGGPVMKVAGAQNRRPIRAMAEGDMTWSEFANALVTERGPAMTFVAVGLLSFVGAVTKHRKWVAGQTRGLPTVVDEQGLPYSYELLPGSRRVEIFLPVGKKVDHHVSRAAARDPRQLEVEVLNIVLDNYQSLG